jgi:hypothetical protein
MARDWDWAGSKAREIIPGTMPGAEGFRRDVATALRKADERARAEERTHGLAALKLAHAMQEKAVAAERERIMARLNEPDESMVVEVMSIINTDARYAVVEAIQSLTSRLS